jgi:hypothetical protein
MKKDLTNYKNNNIKLISTNWAKLKLEQNKRDSVIESNSNSVTENKDQSIVLLIDQDSVINLSL